MTGSNSKSILFKYDQFLQEKQENRFIGKIEDYIQQYPFFKLLSDILPSAMYIIDYKTDQYLYVAESCKRVLGFSKEDFYREGRTLSVSRIHPDDLKLYSTEIFQEYIERSQSIPKEDLPYCRFSLSLRMKRKDGIYIKILQQFVVLEATDEGYPILSMGIMTDISQQVTSDKFVFSITKYKNGVCETLFTSENQVRKIENITEREHDVLQAIVQGKSSKEIANILFLSVHTVNAHRRNLLKKTNVKNSVELVEFALQNGIS